MCLSICWRLREENLVGLDVPPPMARDALFWNHVDCHPLDCPFANPQNFPAAWGCETCSHRDGEACGLTGAHLPAPQVCCHYNVRVAGVTDRLCVRTMLGYTWDVPLTHVLDSLNVAYTPPDEDCAEGVLVRPQDLPHSLPNTYGKATTDEAAEEAADALGMPDKFWPSDAPGGPELGDSLPVADVL